MNKEEMKAKYGKPKVPHEWRKTDWFTTLFCTFFGSGMSPKAPGTMGSLAAAIVAYPIAWFCYHYGIHLGEGTVFGPYLHEFFYHFFSIAAIALFFVAIPFVNKAMKDTGTEDPGWIVIDEVCGVWMGLAFVDLGNLLEYPWILLVVFGIFRFFDILKPLGIHQLEKLPKGWGVMADDLLGGIYTAISTLIFWLIFVFVVIMTDPMPLE